MIKFILNFFKRRDKNKQNTKVSLDRKNITETDFIDYDGMGNQGRFPEVKK